MLQYRINQGLAWVRGHRLVCYAAFVALLMVYVGWQAYSDTRTDPVKCETHDSATSAFLVLKEIESGSRRIKASLQVANFSPRADKLEVDSVVPAQDGNNYDPLLSSKPEAMAKSDSGWYQLSLPYTSHPFFYPFESYGLDLRVAFAPDSKASAPLNLVVINYIDELTVESVTQGYSFERPLRSLGAYSIRLRRQRFVRTISLILFIVAFGFLVYIVLKEETNKVLANSLGYLAALWGIRQIIVGSVKLFPTIVDYTTLSLYVLVALIVAYKWPLAQVTRVGRETRPPCRQVRRLYRFRRPQSRSSTDQKGHWQLYE